VERISGPCVASTGPRCEADPHSVRKALCEVEQERLHRCRGDCRSSSSPQHALRSDQDRRSAGPASAAPGARPADDTKNFCDQPDSRFPAGARHGVCEEPIRLKEAIPGVLENANENFTPRIRNLVAMLWSKWKDLELQIVEMNDEVERIASSDDACIRLRRIPGIGPLVATAIVASIGNGAAFHKGREFAAWMGLVPKQHSTGGKTKLYGISKRGNCYLRKILVHGARAVVFAIKTRQDRDGCMVDRARDEGTPQRPNYRHGEQAGADRMGGSRNGTGLPICSEHAGSISEPTSSSPPRSAPDE
jgi:hypothetical protein